jgi:membrane fusion protein, multidrug efflux system
MRPHHETGHFQRPHGWPSLHLALYGLMQKPGKRGDNNLSLYLKLGAGLAGLITLGYGLSIARSRLRATPVPTAPQPVPVTAAKVVRQDVPIVLEGLGTVQALYTATIRTQATGTLEEDRFSKGQKVMQGPVLAKIDPRPFQTALDQAIAALGRDQAQLDQAKAALGRDQAHLANAQLDLAHYTLLARQHSAPREQADTQRALVAQDEEIVKVDQAAIEYANTELSYTTITAPFDGITGIRLIDPATSSIPLTQRVLSCSRRCSQSRSSSRCLPPTFPIVQEALAKGEVKVDAYTADDKPELDQGRLLLIDNHRVRRACRPIRLERAASRHCYVSRPLRHFTRRQSIRNKILWSHHPLLPINPPRKAVHAGL